MRVALRKERREKLDKKIRNATKEIMESYRREQRINGEKVMHSNEQNPRVLLLHEQSKEKDLRLDLLKWIINMNTTQENMLRC